MTFCFAGAIPDGSNLWEQTAILARDFINPNLRIRYK